MTTGWRESTESSDLLERHPAAAVVVGADGRIAYWNRAASDLLGFSADEAVGQDWEDLVVPSDQYELRRELVRQIAQGGAACFIADRKRKDGTTVPLSIMMDSGTGEDAGLVYLTLRGADLAVCLCSSAPANALRKPAKTLTTRQRQVLRQISEGRSTRDIAAKLGLSVKTIETHRGHLMLRLKLKSVAGLVRYAVSIGLVPASPWGKNPKEG